ncbi:hypothetical protein MHYP_G00299990 [Metynnis hypsauchen]
MQEKARLVLELRESTDRSVRNANIGVLTGRKWNAQTKLDQAISRLQHQETVGRVQVGRAGLGWGDVPRFWSKANRKERKEMVVAEGRYRWRHDQVLRKLAEVLEECRQGSNAPSAAFVAERGAKRNTKALLP